MGWTCSHKPMTSQPPMKDNPTPAPGPLSNVDEVVVAAFRTWQTSHVEGRLETWLFVTATATAHDQTSCD